MWYVDIRDGCEYWLGEMVCLFCCFFCFFFFQAEDGIRDSDMWLEFRRVLFRSYITVHLISDVILVVIILASAVSMLLSQGLTSRSQKKSSHTNVYHRAVQAKVLRVMPWYQHVRQEVNLFAIRSVMTLFMETGVLWAGQFMMIIPIWGNFDYFLWWDKSNIYLILLWIICIGSCLTKLLPVIHFFFAGSTVGQNSAVFSSLLKSN